MTKTTPQDLEAQIAKAIKGGTAAELAALVAPADRAARQAEEEADAARARALDPALAGSALAEARRQAEDAKFAAERAAAAADRLREAHAAAVEAEEQERRRQVYAQAQAARDAAASALAARYVALADELAGLLEAGAKADAMVDQANAALPTGAARIPAVDYVRPGAAPLTKSLTKITLPAWRADAPALWGMSDRLGDGQGFIRTRPAEHAPASTPEEVA